MALTRPASRSFGTTSLPELSPAQLRLTLAISAAYIFAGFVAWGTVVVLTPASVLAVGVVMLLAGVGQLIDTVPEKRRLRLRLWLGAAALWGAAVIAALAHILLPATLLMLALGIALIALGAERFTSDLGPDKGLRWVGLTMSLATALLLVWVIVAR